jgi:5-methylcytosine-specific restriction endonuclease McrBC regulatory subunit McrC
MAIELLSQAPKTNNVSHIGSNNMVDLEVLRKWQDALLASKKECIWLIAHMFYLLKTKNDCKIELSLINCQQLNHNQLFQNAMVTL